MQLVINIDNESLVDKIIKILEVFKNDGVKIIKREKLIAKKANENLFTKEYLEENWRELVMTSSDSSNYYKSEEYYEDRAKDYEERGKN